MKKIIIDQKIFEMFPDFKRGIIIVESIVNETNNQNIQKLLEKEIQNKLQESLDNPNLIAWDETHKKFGSNPKDYPPSAKNLIKRVQKNPELPFINTVVALFNYISLKYLIPCGGDDIEKIEGNLKLGFSRESERFIPLGKTESELEFPKNGEVIYFDDKTGNVMCRKWNWKNGDFTKIQTTSKRIVINLDGIGVINRETIIQARDELAYLLTKYCKAKITVDLLESSHNEITLELNNIKRKFMKDLTSLKNTTEELISEELLQEHLASGQLLKHYIGFEISGKPHIGSGLMTMKVIKSLQELGIKTTILLADWHAWINDKLGGDLEFIKEFGNPYFQENMIAAALCVGLDPKSIEFIKASDLVKNDMYWATLIDLAKNTTLSRIQRSIDIMGRKEGEKTDFAKLIYPCMQATDIFYMQTHIMHGGMDQRKAHVIAIDTAMNIKYNPFIINNSRTKPIAIHHHLLLGLLPPPKELIGKEISQELWADLKMSKSKPGSAIFMNDTEKEVEDKIKKAYCPEGEIKLNPILDWAKHLCFDLGSKKLEIRRKAEWGGDKIYTNYEDLENDFVSKKLHPMDLKDSVARSINEILKPAREHMKKREIQELGEKVLKKTSR